MTIYCLKLKMRINFSKKLALIKLKKYYYRYIINKYVY